MMTKMHTFYLGKNMITTDPSSNTTTRIVPSDGAVRLVSTLVLLSGKGKLKLDCLNWQVLLPS